MARLATLSVLTGSCSCGCRRGAGRRIVLSFDRHDDDFLFFCEIHWSLDLLYNVFILLRDRYTGR